jgi:hypothetical protein
MTRGIFICDGCERLINQAHIIPLTFTAVGVSQRAFTFAFCDKCNRIEVHRTVLSRAAKEFAEWAGKNKKTP